jgi:UDP-N-acetylglucosamine 2-epimerase (non-hydrolysing)
MARFPAEFEQILVHTGQHYDPLMSEVFFGELDLPEPELNLEVGSGSHAWQTAQVMLRFEPVVNDYKPDWVFVVGDVNSTLACSLVCSKLAVKVAHVEAGLRSFDRSMPEEINRQLTDHIADLLFTPSPDGDQNLVNEGISHEKICFVGNVMIDTLVRLLPNAELRWDKLRRKYGIDRYMLVTLHRPSNVDEPASLKEIVAALRQIGKEITILFPVHPRTRDKIAEYQLSPPGEEVRFLEPLGYLDFLALQAHASLVLTDSGGIQEETTFLHVPCLTARPNTERPVTLTHGTNRLVESNYPALVTAIRAALDGGPTTANIPPLWDGRAAERIVKKMRSIG